MSDFDINVCGSYTDMVLSILDQTWNGEAVTASEDSRVLPAGVLIRVFEDSYPAATPIKCGATIKLVETVNSILRAWGFAPLDEAGSVIRYRCPGSRDYVALYIVEETQMRKEIAA